MVKMVKMPKNILLVEDEAIVLLDLRLQLESLGYKVYIADNGKDAIAIDKNEQLDFVVMDINLKGNMDGIEIAKSIFKNSKTPIIFSTANPDMLKKENLEFETFFVKKPFNVEKLLELMDHLLKEKSSD